MAVCLAITAAAQENKSKTISLSKESTPESIHQQIYEQTAKVKNGQECVNFTAEKYIGENINLAQYKDKVVFICFWGTWCGPCLKELKPEHLPAIVRPYLDNKDFVFIPVAQDSREALDKFFNDEKRKDYLWLKDYTCVDADRSIFALYANRGIPRSVIIDRDGKVSVTSVGSTDYALSLITDTLKKLLEQ